MDNTLAIVFIILFEGVFGGLVNYFTVYTKKESGSNRRCLGDVLGGIAASCLVPLFLSMISSDLIVNSRKDDKYYFVFGGLCLVAAIFSRRFINSIGKKILEQVEKSNEKLNKAEEKSNRQQFVIEDLTEQLGESLINHLIKLNGNKDDNGKL